MSPCFISSGKIVQNYLCLCVMREPMKDTLITSADNMYYQKRGITVLCHFCKNDPNAVIICKNDKYLIILYDVIFFK